MNTRYFYCSKTRQIIQLSGLTMEKPFDDDWIETDKTTFEYLLSLMKQEDK